MSEPERFEGSPEFEEWVEGTGERGEEKSGYYNDWHRRVLKVLSH